MGAFSGLNNLKTLWVLHDKPNRLLVLESWSQLCQTMQRIQNEIYYQKKKKKEIKNQCYTWFSKSLEYNTCQFGKENIRNSVKEIFNRGSSSYKRQLERLKMNKFTVSFYDKKLKRLRWKSSVDRMIINTYLVWLGMSETCYTRLAIKIEPTNSSKFSWRARVPARERTPKAKNLA